MGFTSKIQSHYDVVVVGAGAAGAAYIQRLTESGLRVLAIEKGPFFKNHRDDFIENELGIFNHLWDSSSYEVEGDAFRATPNLGRAVGGGTLAWTAVALRFFERDFHFKKHWKVPAQSSVTNWPISLKDLDLYYQQAELHMGVSGTATVWDQPNAALPPNPALDFYPGSNQLKTGFDKLGYRWAPGRIATNSRPYNNASECLHCGFCRSGCRVDAKYQADKVLIEPALASGFLDLAYECTVVELLTSGDGKQITALRFVDDQSGEELKVSAEHVVLCNNPFETTRLLLNSANDAHPNGIGNKFDQVGRHFFCHLGVVGLGFTEQDLRASTGHNMGNIMSLDPCNQGRDKNYVGGFTLLSLNGAGAGVAAIDPLEHFQGPELQEKMSRFNRALFMVSFIEGLPAEHNRIRLGQSLDSYGLPQAKVEYDYLENDLLALADARQAMADVMTEAGAGDVHVSREFEAHPMGGMRMGNSPSQSATDKWGRVHGLNNLWVGGASLFVSGSSVNPTLTIHALALRSAEKLAKTFAQQKKQKQQQKKDQKKNKQSSLNSERAYA
ncbi:GMC oxidoreductase [Agaribacterium haliotis]|uniref:GMC oxidoreductase n=1 Tax=Agaribacterium haliotis TaxID=2013869 RepID=UPI000BB57DA8|nr:GMC family oxidoreductase [Agaribacterium haliotis]